jgi:hypothetical protein
MLFFDRATVRKKLKCFSSVSPDDSYINNEITTPMFSFLKNGDIHNTIRAITNLPSLFTSDGDKIKYSALNYATAMRHNISVGNPIFTNIIPALSEIERRDIESITSGRLPTPMPPMPPMLLSPFTNIENATLALILAKEIAYLNRTIEMITLIARRYQEEQEDDHWNSRMNGEDDDDDDDHDDDHDDDEDDTVRSSSLDGNDDGIGMLERTHSSPHYTEDDHYRRRGRSSRAPENQLVATFLIASGNLQTKLSNLCELVGTSIVVVNAMTTIDQPPTEANRAKQLQAENIVISSIYTGFCQCRAEQRDPIVTAFIELRDISVHAWRIMSMMAFSNLFRLTAGTKFAIHNQHPDDAIFTQGRDYGFMSEKVAEVMRHKTAATETEEIPEYD